MSRIYDEVANFSNHGGKSSFIAGIDQSNTSYQALANLLTIAKENLYIHHDKNFNITFHPKIYIFGNNEIEKFFVGSSNLTAGGLFLNYEANLGVTLDSSNDSNFFRKEINTYWNELLEEENTKKADLPFLNHLLELGSLVDENKSKPLEKYIGKISNVPFNGKKKLKPLPTGSNKLITDAPSERESFAMSLSGFDVSEKSQDPIILIPLTALKIIT